MTTVNLRVGDRVQLHPRLDLWMQGHRYGTVWKVGRKYVHVRLDGGRITYLRPEDLAHVF